MPETEKLGIIRKKHLYIDARLTEESFRAGRDGLNPERTSRLQILAACYERSFLGFGMVGGFELMEKLCHVRFPE